MGLEAEMNNYEKIVTRKLYSEYLHEFQEIKRMN